jgi:hypothetical protein
MEEHFLKEFVSGVSRETPKPWYNPEGDCIVYQMVDEAIIADRIDGVLTIYRSVINNRPIGYQIKGVGALASRFGWRGIRVDCVEDKDKEELQNISMYAILLAAYEQGPQTIGRRNGYVMALESCASHSRIGTDEMDRVLS